MRFGLFVPQGWRHDLVGFDPAQQRATMNDLAQHADAGDWESIWVYDHSHTVPVPSAEATHEAWTLMAAFAATTKRVRRGQMCTCMSYRNPTYLAKVAATVDIVSGGRTEMGIGGGWYAHAWRASGYGFPSAGTRLGQLREGVDITRQACTTGTATATATATLDGKHYQVDGAARGLRYGIFYSPEAAYDRSGIELFEREVMPALKDGAPGDGAPGDGAPGHRAPTAGVAA